MKTLWSFETSVVIQQSARRNFSEDQYHCKDLIRARICSCCVTMLSLFQSPAVFAEPEYRIMYCDYATGWTARSSNPCRGNMLRCSRMVQTASEAHPAPCTLHFSTRCILVVTFTSPTLYPRGKSPDTSWVVGCVTCIVGTVVSEKRYIFLWVDPVPDPDSWDVQRLVWSVYWQTYVCFDQDISLFKFEHYIFHAKRSLFIQTWTLYLSRKEKSMNETSSRLCVELHLVLWQWVKNHARIM
jgi:hypothetical protein